MKKSIAQNLNPKISSVKKIIFAFIPVVASINAFSQADSPKHKTDSLKNKNYNANSRTDTAKQFLTIDTSSDICSIEMLNGRMMKIVDGKTFVMLEETTLKNGTIVKTNGFIKSNNGKVFQLREGECIDELGQLIRNEKILPMKETRRIKE